MNPINLFFHIGFDKQNKGNELAMSYNLTKHSKLYSSKEFITSSPSIVYILDLQK